MNVWKLRTYLKPYLWAALLAPLFMVLEVCMDLLQPRLMASVINEGVVRSDLGHIWHTGLLMIGAALVGLLGGMGCTVFSSRAALGFGADLRLSLFQKVQTFSFDNLDRLTTGSLVTRLTGDVMQVQNQIQILLRAMVRSAALAVGSIAMMIALSPRLSLMLLAVVPLLMIILYTLIRLSVPLFGRVQEKLDGLNTVLQENLKGIRVVKAFVRSAVERERYGKANREHLEVALKAARTVAANMPLMMLVLNAGIVAVLWYGGAQTWEGTMPVGDLIAYLSYMSQLLFSLLSVGMLLISFSRAKASADRICEVLETQPGIAEAKQANAGAIGGGHVRFDQVSFSYDPGKTEFVLKDVSFAVERGQTVGILGATGSGKSSLVGLIPRLFDATEGRVLIDGTDVRDIDSKHLRSQVGIVLQQAILFSGTIRDNIRYGRPDASQEEVEAAARAAQAHEFIARMPDGYDTELGQRGVNLSGGQKQRLSIARALLLRPKILILDDSTSAVDLVTEARIRESLEALMSETTCIVIAQRIASVTEADQILVLEDGVIAARGTHRELLQSSAIYRDIYRSQHGKEASIRDTSSSTLSPS
ncbi:multidrug ABC transporter ATP-binding protein [Paenibacillus elgii]|uniref:Multidrug ABC transporter ATP-binding protein n=1 Tax=Paenibacillus elgii TaxID=189691 RepID=A0A2T6FTD5_9BACL|nr:ABC transporter ATP-binding protein [Paenibacillus elgii]PUA35165.1 multidrug ABC transporter ATP-binding protein [Paenibacillus elgii]